MFLARDEKYILFITEWKLTSNNYVMTNDKIGMFSKLISKVFIIIHILKTKDSTAQPFESLFSSNIM